MSCAGLNSCPVPPGNSSALSDVGGATVVGQGEASLDPSTLAEPVIAPPIWQFPPGPAPAPQPVSQPAAASSEPSQIPSAALHPSTRGERTVTVGQLEDRWARQDSIAAQQAAVAGQEEPVGNGAHAQGGVAAAVLAPFFGADTNKGGE